MSARRRMALRLLLELLCVGVSQDVAGVFGVLQGLVRSLSPFCMSPRQGASATASRLIIWCNGSLCT